MRTFIMKQILLSKTNILLDENYRKVLPVSLTTAPGGTTLPCISKSEICNLIKLSHGPLEPYAFSYSDNFGRIRIGCDVLGSTLRAGSMNASSVISAYWPNFGSNIHQFDSRPNIGKVQYYFRHSVTLREDHTELSKILQYTFANIHWMEYHHQCSLYGISATVCANSTRDTSLCSIYPCCGFLENVQAVLLH